VRTLEKIEEKQRERHRQDEERRERKRVDEAATQAFARRETYTWDA
jgi:flagellar biosynthesis chaperone FliJ